MPFYHDMGVATFEPGDKINADIAGCAWYDRETLKELTDRKLTSKEKGLQLNVLQPFLLSSDRRISVPGEAPYDELQSRLLARAAHRQFITEESHD